MSPNDKSLYDAITQKTVDNSYYDDERNHHTKTPDLNKAYKLIQALLETPENFLETQKTIVPVKTCPNWNTTLGTYIKVAIMGDFNSQLNKESNREDNLKTITKLCQTAKSHPHLFPKEFWDEKGYLETTHKGKCYSTKYSPIENGSWPENLEQEIQKTSWPLYQTIEKSLLGILARRIQETLQDWRWANTPNELQFQTLYSITTSLKDHPNFAPCLAEEIGIRTQKETDENPEPPDEENITLLKTYAKKALHPKPNPYELYSLTRSDSYTTYTTRDHILLHILTQKSYLPLLTNSLKKEVERKTRKFLSLQSQQNIPNSSK